jgi:hypothetical protein
VHGTILSPRTRKETPRWPDSKLLERVRKLLAKAEAYGVALAEHVLTAVGGAVLGAA